MSFYDRFAEDEQALLRRRAERAALSSLDTPEVLASIDTLVVMLGDEPYGLPLRALTAAYQATTPVVPVPCTPPFVAGIANIRGHVVPVIDLAALLGISDTTPPDFVGIVVATNDVMTVAFRVSAIGDAILVKVGELVPVSGLFDLAKREYLQGVLPDGTIVLNMDAILNDPALIVNETVG
jgi:purine-binding chemotaxis protein CheW